MWIEGQIQVWYLLHGPRGRLGTVGTVGDGVGNGWGIAGDGGRMPNLGATRKGNDDLAWGDVLVP